MKKKLNWLNAQWELDSKESIEKDINDIINEIIKEKKEKKKNK